MSVDLQPSGLHGLGEAEQYCLSRIAESSVCMKSPEEARALCMVLSESPKAKAIFTTLQG